MINKVILIGRAGGVPEIRTISNDGRKAASFRLATSEKYKGRDGVLKENTEWHSIVCYDKSANLVEEYLEKGMMLYIEGKLRTRDWTTQNGEKKYTTEVLASSIRFLSRGGSEQRPSTKAVPQSTQDEDGDLPF